MSARAARLRNVFWPIAAVAMLLLGESLHPVTAADSVQKPAAIRQPIRAEGVGGVIVIEPIPVDVVIRRRIPIAPVAIDAAERIAQARITIRQAAPVAQVDDDGNEIVVEVRQFTITHQHLDQWIFGSNKTVTAARAEFETQLNSRVEALATKYELDAARRRKLQLAGRGDIKRFIGEAESLHAELGDVATLDQQEYIQIQQRAMALRNRYLTTNRVADGVAPGLFDEHSLLSKTIPKAISPKFTEQFLADRKRHQEQQYEVYLTQSIQNLTQFLTLREDQKEKLKALIRTEVPPPARINQYVYTYVMYQLSRMPNDKLSQVLDEAQIGKLGQIKANAARYEEYLRANGLLPESEDESQEDAK